MNIREFQGRASSHMATVAETGQPLHVHNRGHEYMSVVPTGEWKQAEQALSTVRGLLKIVRADQGADGDCDRYRAFGQMLTELVDAGHLDITEGVTGHANVTT